MPPIRRARLLSILAVIALAGPIAGQALRINGPYYGGGNQGGEVLDFVGDPTGTRLAFRAETLDESRGVLHSVLADGSGPPVRLNGDLGTIAEVTSVYAFSVDGTRVLYIGDEVTNNAYDLYTVTADGGGSPSRLSAGILPGGGVLDFQLAPDGTCAIFRADSSDGIIHLYSGPVDGSAAPTQLDTAVSSLSDVFTYAINVDSSRVVYVADEVVNISEIYSVPIDGSSLPVKLNPDFAATQNVSSFAISPFGDRVAYKADRDIDTVFELYSVPIDGGSLPVKLNQNLSGNSDIEEIFFTAVGDLVYRADQVVAGTFDVYLVPSDGSSSESKINPTLVAGGSISTLAVSADGLTGVYLADQDTDEVFELYTFPTDGSMPPTKVSGVMPAAGDVYSFQISPDGSRVIYSADQETDEKIELWGAPTDGSTAPVKLNPAAGDYVLDTAGFSPQSDRVTFLGSEQAGSGQIRFFSVPPDGSLPPVELNNNLAPDRDVKTGAAVGGPHAAYIANKRDPMIDELFVALVDGSTAAKRIPVDVFPATGDVRDPKISPRGNRVVFRARQDTNQFDVYSAILNGTQNWVMVNDPLPAGRLSLTPGFTADGSRILYRAEQFVADRYELFSTPADGSGSPVLLSQPLGPGQQVDSYLAADDYVVFHVAELGLFRVPPDGSQAPVMLNGPLMPGTFLGFPWRLSRPANRVAYRAEELSSLDELYSAPIDGAGGASVRVNDPLTTGQEVENDFAFSPDGAWLVYRVDGPPQELFSAPSDGSGSPVKLNDPPVSGGRVTEFEISLDSQLVVYRADQDTDAIQEIYSVPIDGSAAPLRLNVPMPSSADVTDMVISPDGNWVVYRSDHEINNTHELYSVPSTGGATTKLSTIGTASGNVNTNGFEASVGNVVVYLQRIQGVRELFSVPIDGSSAPTRLHQPLVNPLEVVEFSLVPDGSQVIFEASLVPDTPPELWVSPIDASHPPRRLSRPDPAGFVLGHEVDPAGKKVVFTGFQIADQELFMSFLAPARKKAPPTPQGSFSGGVIGK